MFFVYILIGIVVAGQPGSRAAGMGRGGVAAGQSGIWVRVSVETTHQIASRQRVGSVCLYSQVLTPL